MKEQNEMMNFVWLLNAAASSAYETCLLYREFLEQSQGFQKVINSVPAGTPQSKYMEEELRKNLETLEDYQKIIQEVIDLIKTPKRSCSQNEQ